MSRDHYSNVLQFWRSIETFNLPELPPSPRRNEPAIHTRLGSDSRLPWEPGVLPALNEGRQWKHTLYFYIVAKEAVIDVLAQLSQSKEFREPVMGLSFFSALVLDHLGQPVERSYFPAAFIYGIKILQEKMDLKDLPELLRKAQEEAGPRFQVDSDEQPPGKTMDWPLLEKELHYLQSMTRHGLNALQPVLCVSESVFAGAGMDASFSNSYFVNDLNSLIGDISGIGKPLETYLSRKIAVRSRRDLLNQEALLKCLHPKLQCPGRWPSDPAFGLYSAQQAALYQAMPDLRNDAALIGINGPPGTGKTTLLREVIADVVVDRAKRLLQADVGKLFTGKRNALVDMIGYYPIDRLIFGNDGVVVSSNNNTAIENISKELPVADSIDRKSFGEADYFAVAASRIYEQPCWGMLSAVLGRAGNLNNFVSSFWFSKKEDSPGFGQFLKEQYDDPVNNLKNYTDTALELRDLLDTYDAFHRIASEYHELLLQILFEGKGSRKRLEDLGSRLMTDHEIPAANLPGMDFLHLPLEKIHGLTPYSSVKINTLRSKIFLSGLELHEWAIRVNARQFNSNLNAWVNMVSNRHSGVINEKVAGMLWDSFFFCIPVVSVTLASFQRQFAKMGQGSIGWLLLDEAGQATPVSACGAIWRSERCIIIGDTLQIPPVVTIPAELGKLLQGAYAVKDDCWNPISHSAQFLADRVTGIGTYINRGDCDPTWTGIPLRAHRRCSEPMFSISNNIAYNGQMVKVTPDLPLDIPTGASGWIDVGGVTQLDGHVIAEEMQVLHHHLLQLRYYTGKIYVISPFQTIAKFCQQEFFVKDRVECGTIHVFQGKEAGIVFLVLGTQAGSVRARDWVAQRPNMLNVAVTRAKERLYVIGNRKIWGMHPYFDHLAKKLPVKDSGLLFSGGKKS